MAEATKEYKSPTTGTVLNELADGGFQDVKTGEKFERQYILDLTKENEAKEKKASRSNSNGRMEEGAEKPADEAADAENEDKAPAEGEEETPDEGEEDSEEEGSEDSAEAEAENDK